MGSQLFEWFFLYSVSMFLLLLPELLLSVLWFSIVFYQHLLSVLLFSISFHFEEEGFGYSPALLTLASLYESGYEPAIQQDPGQAARHYMSLLQAQVGSQTLSNDLLEEARRNQYQFSSFCIFFSWLS